MNKNNKEIIIDGTDVSGCEFFDECEIKLDWSDCLAHCSPYPEGVCYEDCSEHPNCYYKQLERLKEHHHKTECEASENLKKLVKLEQECEELKKANDEKNEFLNKLGCPTTAAAKRKVNCLEQQLKETYEGLLSIQYKLADNNKQLRQTLAEIKEIITTALEQNTLINLDKILQKINGVENDRT